MKHLWGLRQIAAYAGWKDPRSPRQAMKRDGFIMIRRRKAGHPRPMWYTNSDLVRAWMISKARADREWLLERDRAKEDQNGAAEGARSA